MPTTHVKLMLIKLKINLYFVSGPSARKVIYYNEQVIEILNEFLYFLTSNYNNREEILHLARYLFWWIKTSEYTRFLRTPLVFIIHIIFIIILEHDENCGKRILFAAGSSEKGVQFLDILTSLRLFNIQVSRFLK